jgi:hypothetical protein
MRTCVAATPLLLLSVTCAVAADTLPLRRGIYVQAGIPCKGASNADTLSYWGEDNGINGQQTACKITAMHRDGPLYSVNRTCTSLRFGGSFNDHVKITVLNQRVFKLRARRAHGATERMFRYCGPKVQL